MTDSVKGFYVVLERDQKDEQADATLSAIRHVRGVLSVEPVPADSLVDHFSEKRVQHEYWEKIHAIFWPRKS